MNLAYRYYRHVRNDVLELIYLIFSCLFCCGVHSTGCVKTLQKTLIITMHALILPKTLHRTQLRPTQNHVRVTDIHGVFTMSLEYSRANRRADVPNGL